MHIQCVKTHIINTNQLTNTPNNKDNMNNTNNTNNTNITDNMNNAGVFICEYCNTSYKYKKNYNRHFQTCNKKDNIIAVTKDYDIPNDVMDSFIKSWKRNPNGICELAKHNFDTTCNGSS